MTVTTLTASPDGLETTTVTDTLDFFYSASGDPLYVSYNGTPYYYAANLQGDTVAILDGSGNPVVTYTYDAWGKLLSIDGNLKDTLGAFNPLTYRGYVYDTETKFYYLQSRYYNPTVSRFLNADAFASTGQGLLGNNMFAYCLNNSINREDCTGTCSYNKTTGTRNDCGRRDCPYSSNYTPYTISMGGVFGFGIGPLSMSLQIVLATDSAGNSEIQISYSSPNIFSTSLPSTDEMLADITADKPKHKFSVSIAGCVTVTNAPSVQNLYGPTYSVGRAGAGIAVDYNFIPVGDGSDKIYSGVTVAGGAITPGTNMNMSNTVFGISVPFSVFDVIEGINNGIFWS